MSHPHQYLKLLVVMMTSTFITQQAFGQLFLFNSNKRTDTSIWLIRNKSKGIIPGNSTYFAAAVNFARSREAEFSIGRSNIIRSDYSRGIVQSNISTWGFSCAFSKWAGQDQYTGKFFLEHIKIPPFLLGNFVLRTDYSVNFTNKQQYLRPSLGVTLFYADLLYSYSFKTAGPGINQYRHGFTLRSKFYASRKKAEWNYHIWKKEVWARYLRMTYKL
ncbi:MAG TPA: hypothetical protein PLU11_03145 [Chitinophagaceae bacterium]|nr:hypothetical protein [Chitinophagaceae bacterium]HPN58136.1 hypothetical protein [Chitinophagaceae bacterium]